MKLARRPNLRQSERDFGPVSRTVARRLHLVHFVACLIAAFAISTSPGWAQPIRIVIENKNFVPYTTWDEGEAGGACTEIAAGAIRQMNAKVEYIGVPWSRALLMIRTRKADAALCGLKTDERAAFSYFPDEALLHYDATLFVDDRSKLLSSTSSALAGMRYGVIMGYAYDDVDRMLQAAGLVRKEALDRSSLLTQLITGKVDMILDSRLPTNAEARRLAIEGQIRPLEPSLSRGPAFLFFSKTPGHKDLARRFSDALSAFKKTDEYRQIVKRYGL